MVICDALDVTPEQLLTGKGIDEDYVEREVCSDKAIISNEDIRIIEDIHSLKTEQRDRLMKYMEALKQIDELEDLQ